MISYSDKTEILEIIRERVEGVDVLLKTIDYNGTISLFIVSCNDENLLSNSWNRISGLIGAYYQSDLKTEYEKWNLYVMYLIPIKIPQSLKYKIENDRFSSRKIVIDSYTKAIDDINIEFLIQEHITNVDLSLARAVETGKREYKSKSPIWKIVREGKIKPGKGSTLEASKLMARIVKTLKK